MMKEQITSLDMIAELGFAVVQAERQLDFFVWKMKGSAGDERLSYEVHLSEGRKRVDELRRQLRKAVMGLVREGQAR